MQVEFIYSQIPAALVACYQTGVDLPLRIRELRQERGMTLSDLAGKIGVSIPHMSEVERGKKNLNNHLMVRIADALGVLPADLIKDSGDHGAELTAIIGLLSDDDIERVLTFAQALAASSKAGD